MSLGPGSDTFSVGSTITLSWALLVCVSGASVSNTQRRYAGSELNFGVVSVTEGSLGVVEAVFVFSADFSVFHHIIGDLGFFLLDTSFIGYLGRIGPSHSWAGVISLTVLDKVSLSFLVVSVDTESFVLWLVDSSTLENLAGVGGRANIGKAG